MAPAPVLVSAGLFHSEELRYEIISLGNLPGKVVAAEMVHRFKLELGTQMHWGCRGAWTVSGHVGDFGMDGGSETGHVICLHVMCVTW